MEIRHVLSIIAAVSNSAAIGGLAMSLVHLLLVRRHLRGPVAAPAVKPPISILKPLCGLDDRLLQNLATFAELPYPNYEVLLGVRDMSDAAYETAIAVTRRWPRRFRVVVQGGEPGLNPKVNQLMTLVRAARNEIVVISDSNTRVPPGYLDEIAAHLEDPTVGLVTHPIAGEGDEQCGARLGSALDNMHMSGGITPGLTAAKLLCGKDYVVGKSMAMRCSDLRAIGGFGVVKDVLAEDFVLGRLIPEKLGKRVVLARSVVRCVSLRRSMRAFVKRYARWSVMQHQCAGIAAYWGLLLLNPVLLATFALTLRPSALTAAVWLACALGRIALDGAAGHVLRGRTFAAWALAWAPLKDLLIAAAWFYGLTNRTIEWRSHRLTVLRGSVLSPELPLLPLRPRRARAAPAAPGRGPASATA
jgi:ceramide glucosyltransferase